MRNENNMDSRRSNFFSFQRNSNQNFLPSHLELNDPINNSLIDYLDKNKFPITSAITNYNQYNSNQNDLLGNNRPINLISCNTIHNGINFTRNNFSNSHNHRSNHAVFHNESLHENQSESSPNPLLQVPEFTNILVHPPQLIHTLEGNGNQNELANKFSLSLEQHIHNSISRNINRDIQQILKQQSEILNTPILINHLTDSVEREIINNNYQNAIKIFSQILSLDNYNGPTLVAMGHCFLFLNEVEKAFESYELALNLLPNFYDLQLWFAIGLLYEKLNLFENAIPCYFSCLKISSDYFQNFEINYRLGLLIGKSGYFEDALKYFNLALQSTPENFKERIAEIQLKLGICYYKIKNYNKSLDYLKNIPKEYNKNKILLHLAFVYFLMNNISEAESHLSKYKNNMNEIDTEYYYLNALCKIKGSKLDEAERLIKLCLSSSATNGDFLSCLGIIKALQNNLFEGFQLFFECIKEKQHTDASILNISIIYELMNLTNDSITLCAKISPSSQLYMSAQERLQALRLAENCKIEEMNRKPNFIFPEFNLKDSLFPTMQYNEKELFEFLIKNEISFVGSNPSQNLINLLRTNFLQNSPSPLYDKISLDSMNHLNYSNTYIKLPPISVKNNEEPFLFQKMKQYLKSKKSEFICNNNPLAESHSSVLQANDLKNFIMGINFPSINHMNKIQKIDLNQADEFQPKAGCQLNPPKINQHQNQNKNKNSNLITYHKRQHSEVSHKSKEVIKEGDKEIFPLNSKIIPKKINKINESNLFNVDVDSIPKHNSDFISKNLEIAKNVNYDQNLKTLKMNKDVLINELNNPSPHKLLSFGDFDNLLTKLVENQNVANKTLNFVYLAKIRENLLGLEQNQIIENQYDDKINKLSKRPIFKITKNTNRDKIQDNNKKSDDQFSSQQCEEYLPQNFENVEKNKNAPFLEN